MLTNLTSRLREYIRVFKLTRKPTPIEFKTIVKVTGIGILIIGLIGALLQITWLIIT